MKLAGDFNFDGPVTEVWQALLDPVVLAAVMPGCEKLELVDGAYLGELNIKVGPVQGKFEGKVTIFEVEEEAGYSISVDAKGSQGFVKATGSVRLTPQGAADTRVDYDAEVRVGGRIASVGQRLIEASAKAIVKESLDGLNHNVKARASATEGGEAQLVEANQADFTRKVAQEVAREIIPQPARYVLIALALLAAAALAYVCAR
jgi:carbon monoxide dehydrogenase subunit G